MNREPIRPQVNSAAMFFTPLETAIHEIRERRKNTELVNKVHAFLQEDIPKHFDREEPVMYLSRHIATPNYEALHFYDMVRTYDLPIVIGQDSEGIFAPNNELKRCLGKLPVTKGFSKRLDEIIENFTILDFTKNQGRTFSQIKTFNNTPLIEYHNNLLQDVYPGKIEIAEESDWINRNHRDDILNQYKHMLALLCVHGVMFESYTDEESLFVEKILYPAFFEVEEKIGCRPLIVEHIDEVLEATRDWNGYPSIFYKRISSDFEDV